MVRLVDLVDDIAAHPYLGDRVALTGGTGLAMFVLDAPRLSFDLDLNYIGAGDPDAMKADRPRFEAEMQVVIAITSTVRYPRVEPETPAPPEEETARPGNGHGPCGG